MYHKVIQVNISIKKNTQEELRDMKHLVENMHATIGMLSEKLDHMLEPELIPVNEQTISQNNRHLSIKIKSWDDLFCKFEDDTFSMGEKTLSTDLIEALKLRNKLSKNNLDLNNIIIYAPKRLNKSKQIEQKVITSVNSSLYNKFKTRRNTIRKNVAYRVTTILAGGGLITLGALLGFSSGPTASIVSAVGTLGIWQGLSGLYDNFSKYYPDVSFLKKLSKANITVIYR